MAESEQKCETSLTAEIMSLEGQAAVSESRLESTVVRPDGDREGRGS